MKKHLALLLLLTPLSTWGADTIFSESYVQDGGSIIVEDDSALFVTDATNDPKLTLTNSAVASWEGATVIGRLEGESGQLEILGGSTLANTGTSSLIGEYGSANIYRGRSYLGLNSGAQGSALVSGTGSNWSTSQYLYLGYRGEGTLRIENEGTVSSDFVYISYEEGSQGALTVSGSGSELIASSRIEVAYHNNGSLRIEDGGKVSSAVVAIGYGADIEGSAVVTGAGSTWENSSDITVGNTSKGTLLVENGAVLKSLSGHIGYNFGSEGEVTVTGEGSQWVNSGHLHVGRFSKATLRVEDGATVTAALGSSIGSNDHSEGTVVVTGAGSSLTISDNLILGGHDMTSPPVENTGTLEISDGAKVYISGTLRTFTGSSVTVDGGSIRFNDYNRSSEGTFDFISGTVQLGGDHSINSSDAATRKFLGTTPTIGAEKSFIIEGTARLESQLTLDGGTFGFNAYQRNQNGSLVYNFGTILLLGDRTIGSDAAITEIFGATPSIAENKELAIEGEATLLAQTTLTVDGLLTAQEGLSVAAEAIIGGNGTIDGDLTLLAGGKFQFTLNSTLTVTGDVLLDSSFGISSLMGFDSSVDFGSYTLIDGTATNFASLNIRNWGSNHAYYLGDGKIAYFRQGSLTLEVAEAIPEPGSVLLMVLGLGGAVLYKRRRK